MKRDGHLKPSAFLKENLVRAEYLAQQQTIHLQHHESKNAGRKCHKTHEPFTA